MSLISLPNVTKYMPSHAPYSVTYLERNASDACSKLFCFFYHFLVFPPIRSHFEDVNLSSTIHLLASPSLSPFYALPQPHTVTTTTTYLFHCAMMYMWQIKASWSCSIALSVPELKLEMCLYARLRPALVHPRALSLPVEFSESLTERRRPFTSH